MFRPVLASRALRRNVARHFVAGTRRMSSVSEQPTGDTVEAAAETQETQDSPTEALNTTVSEATKERKAASGSGNYNHGQREKITIGHLRTMKRFRTPITMLTAYDYPTGRACQASDVEITLVGDSLAQVCLGYDSTTRLTLDEMIHHCKAVARGSKAPLLVADMPFGTVHGSPEEAYRNAVRLVREGGAEAVKIEGGAEVAPHIKHLTLAGIPVFAHLGLMPQRAVQFGGYRAQARSFAAAKHLVETAHALEQAGAVAVVLEAVPSEVAQHATYTLKRAFTIGIGAGRYTDGQVLVWDDMLGNSRDRKPRFVRQFGQLRQHIDEGIAAYVNAVRARDYPDWNAQETYNMENDQTRRLFTEWAHGRTREVRRNEKTEGEEESNSDQGEQRSVEASG